VARTIYEDRIDVLIDLSGYYDFSRSEIFAYRPAPVQASYCGFPCTTGADYMDYLIMDRTVCPPGSEQFIAEQIAYMPSTYFMVNDTQQIDDKKITRAEMGLPQEGLVFCCFNSPYKIDPVVFDVWMRLLQQIPNSVLWLFADKQRAQENLITEALKRGVNKQRILFASAMPLSQHLARYRLADLFLDTFWCNAHTTASDALWAGLPVLTCAGEGIQARVAASLLKAIALPELITDTHAAYEQKALYLAQHPEELAALREKLAHNRSHAALFNTAMRVRELEVAYVNMWQQFNRGEKPNSFNVTV
jgi:predicted O-linked N-acetylglucosamine transferase (SPINDLY family)